MFALRAVNVNTYSVKALEIKSNDTNQQIKKLTALLQSYGLDIEIRHHFNEQKWLLENVTIHFKHAQGMDFILAGTGFNRLQFKLLLNNHQQVKYFIYRFNEESFTNPVPLYCKGNKSHQYIDDMVGVSGTTNVDLGYKRLDAY